MDDELELEGTETPFLRFVEIARAVKQKTRVVQVYSKRNKALLGTIKWYGNWRQYCFFPESATIFNRTCLGDIENVIRHMQAEWSAARRVK